MASSDNELESQLMEAGSKLVDPPSSVDELLPLLDKIESYLQKVEQSPTISMQNALSPSLKALVSDKLFRHSNIDVQVVVASCISEITRITAPDAPYDDDQMKEVFQLIVSSFENIDDKSSRSYAKRASILETVAKVRSCVVMLDLECDALIVQMFQHFLKAIRDHHPENIFSSMEIIMTLVLEESEDISLELLSPILATVKKDSKDVLPIARKLGERVLVSCATKLKPYLVQAVDTKSISLFDYSKVLASICQYAVDNGYNEVQASGGHKAVESKTVEASGGEGCQESKGVASETSPLGEVDHAVLESPKPVVDNGLKQTGQNDSLDDSNSLKKQEGDHPIESSEDLKSSKAEPDILENENSSNKEQESEQSTQRMGKMINDSLDDSNSLKKQGSDHPIENSEEISSRKAEPDILENENTSKKEQESDQSTKGGGEKINDSSNDSNSLKKQDADHPIENSEDLKSCMAEPDILENEDTSKKEQEPVQSTKRSGKEINESLDDYNSLKKQDDDQPIENSEDLKSSMAAPDILENENTSNKEQEQEPEQSIKRSGKEINESLDDSNSLKKQDSDHPIGKSEDLKSSKAESGILGNENTSNREQESEQSTKRRGKKNHAKSRATSNSSHAVDERESEKLPDQKCHVEDDSASHCEGPPEEVVVPSENNNESDVKRSSPKSMENESTDVASASPTRNHLDEIRTKKSGRQKKKGSLVKDAVHLADDASKKVADRTGDLEVKPYKRSGKKLPSVSSSEKITSTVVDAPVKENIIASDSETKPSKQSAKKVGASNKKNDGSSSNHPVARKKQGTEKDLMEEDTPKAAVKDIKEMISSAKSTKDENLSEVTPKKSAKRKRSPIKDDPDNEGCGEELVGSKIKVWWPADKQYYDGVVDSFDPVKRRHKVLYTDGEQEDLNLRRQKWEIIDPSEGEEETGRLSPQDSDEMPLKKKSKTNSDDAKGGKIDSSSKRSEGASSKSKGMTYKSGRKSKEGSKVDDRSKEDCKSVSKSEIEASGKSKDHASRSGTNKSANVGKKSSSKSKNADYQASKAAISKDETRTPAKSKQDIQKVGKAKQGTLKTTTVSKGKSSQSEGKSNASGTGKVKSGSSKIQENEDVKENLSDSGKVQESTKGKSPKSSKVQGSGAKLGKKRKKGVKY